MIWAKKNTSEAEWAHIKQRYDHLSSGLGLPFNMLMVSCPSCLSGGPDVYLTLPSADHLALFGGFDIVPECNLPEEASLSFGNLEAFRSWFSMSGEEDTVQ
jgi:hypothetical protein